MTSTSPVGMEESLIHFAKPLPKFGKEFKAIIRAGGIRPAARSAGTRQNLRREGFAIQFAKMTASFPGESRKVRRKMAWNAVSILGPKDSVLNK